MNFRFTAILLAVLVALGGYVYFSNAQAEPKIDTATKEVPLFTLDSNAIEQISVRQNNKQVVVTKQENGTWTLSEPALGAADDSGVGAIAARLAMLKASRLLAEKADDLGQYGLEKPSIVLTFNIKGGKTETLLFGNENPNGSYHYVKRADSEAVYLVYTSLGNDLTKWVASPPKQMPTPTPFPTLAPEIAPTTTP